MTKTELEKIKQDMGIILSKLSSPESAYGENGATCFMRDNGYFTPTDVRRITHASTECRARFINYEPETHLSDGRKALNPNINRYFLANLMPKDKIFWMEVRDTTDINLNILASPSYEDYVEAVKSWQKQEKKEVTFPMLISKRKDGILVGQFGGYTISAVSKERLISEAKRIMTVDLNKDSYVENVRIEVNKNE